MIRNWYAVNVVPWLISNELSKSTTKTDIEKKKEYYYYNKMKLTFDIVQKINLSCIFSNVPSATRVAPDRKHSRRKDKISPFKNRNHPS